MRSIFFSTPAHGHINPTLPIVRELISQGEEVTYYSTIEFKEKIEATGANFKDYNLDISGLDPEELTDYAILYRTLMEASITLIDKLLPEIKELNPAYIVHDSLSPWGKYIAKILDIPAISSISTFALTRAVIFQAEEFRPSIPKLIFEDARHLLKGMAIQYHLGKHYGTGPLDFFDSFTNREKLNIVYTALEFQPYAELFDDSFAFVGPSISTEQQELDFSIDTERPVIYISLGTLLNENIPFYHTCFTAFRHMDVLVILSIGEKLDIRELGEIPANFIVRNMVPQVEVLKYADLFITHGGMNSVHEGLYFAVPLIVIPLTNEQRLVARQVVDNKAGIGLTEVSPDLLKETSNTVLDSPTYSYHAFKMSNAFKDAGGYKRAVQAIQAFKDRFLKEGT